MFSRRSMSGQRYSSLTAVILLASFVLLVVQGFADANLFVTSVPACCRTHGRHAASMHGDCNGTNTEGISFHSIREKCPYGPFAAQSFSTTSFIAGNDVSWLALLPVSGAARASHAYQPIFRLSSSNLKRGPPLTQSSLRQFLT